MLTFLAVVMAALGVYSLLSDMFLRDRSRISQRVDRELRKRQREQVRKSTVFKSLAAAESSPAAPSGRAAGRAVTRLRARLEAMIEQSGVSVTPQRLLALMAAAGLT